VLRIARPGAGSARGWRYLMLDGVRSVAADVTRVRDASSVLDAESRSPAGLREWVGFTVAEWARVSVF
jgi:hypothetical protein